MGIKEFYSEIGSSYKDVADRLGSEDFILHFVVKFKEDKNFDLLKAALKNGDTDTAFRAAHTLKGVSANLGFTALYNAVSQITEALRNGDIARAKGLFPHVSEKYAAVLKAIQGL